ncbi:type III-B CRISPR module RAMP protein Cmr4 [Lusitaniella coriacea LEGE 07157]|uniref:Type III-B CRISPR module RAMP protein Cmr4 n=1 Tax=Lusitaniella coriacea LEGE 07157 TaxID=945747 RepID=A0A8J7DUX1_9CYAN|nr:RAMP superfamily CRISPR-associated protein [Lusitaniella coriacea]MBE9114935.1 type III-B CRISPR module RAMP protein Cmr4 [Lusitaniella coriacea LEGE 07157]
MYQKAYGIIETLAPLHVGASAGEETGNLNLIFRDQFTQTGIIPGSSIRGRFRADMRSHDADKTNHWYGHEAIAGQTDGGTTEALVKFEYASLVWLPVFCPGQPVVWVSCPRLLKRYKQISGIDASIPKPYTASPSLVGRNIGNNQTVLFFNLGFLAIEHKVDLSPWIPAGADLSAENLVVVADNDIAMLHDMALYRQSRVSLEPNQKKAKQGAFFDVEALPEGSVLVFPVALKESGWQPFGEMLTEDLYFGGLESIGFGRCRVTLAGQYFAKTVAVSA